MIHEIFEKFYGDEENVANFQVDFVDFECDKGYNVRVIFYGNDIFIS